MQATGNMAEPHLTDPGNDILVVKADDDGFQVFAPAEPDKLYRVSGSCEAPECTCPDYRWRRPDNTNGSCVHIGAVLRHLGFATIPQDEENSRATENEPRPSLSSNGSVKIGDGSPAMMVIKRSVSPDRKIDSLSVEFTLPMTGLVPQQVHDSAMRAMTCQEDIVESFLADQVRSDDHHANGANGANGTDALPATLRDVSGMQTKWGWRYFINVEVNGRTYRLFGRRNELGEQLSKAGLGQLASQIDKGRVLNARCLAVLGDSEDGRYTNVVELRPAGRQQQRGR